MLCGVHSGAHGYCFNSLELSILESNGSLVGKVCCFSVVGNPD